MIRRLWVDHLLRRRTRLRVHAKQWRAISEHWKHQGYGDEISIRRTVRLNKKLQRVEAALLRAWKK